MKTVKLNEVYKRIGDQTVESHLKIGWVLCSKQEWKKKVRDINGKYIAPVKVTKSNKYKDKKDKNQPVKIAENMDDLNKDIVKEIMGDAIITRKNKQPKKGK